MPKGDNATSGITDEQKKAVVEGRMQAAEHALFDAQLTLEVEGAAAQELDEAQRKSLVENYERQVRQAQARVEALRKHLP